MQQLQNFLSNSEMRWVMSKPQKFCAIWCEMTFIWLIFLRILFLQKFSFQAIFSVFRQKNGAPKWTETVNFAKFKIFDGFFISNTVFVLLENYLLSKFQQDQTIFLGLRGQTPPLTPPPPPQKKEVISSMFNQCKKLWKCSTSQLQILYW